MAKVPDMVVTIRLDTKQLERDLREAARVAKGCAGPKKTARPENRAKKK